jgi:hypothetical protein
MTHHRGLVITIVVAVVVAAVGIGVMAAATNDSDESVQEELAPAQFGLTAEDPASRESHQEINLVLFVVGSGTARVSIRPDYDSPPGAKCVKRNATDPPPLQVSRETVVKVGVTVTGTWATGCHINRSQMFWRFSDNTSTRVALIKPAGKRVSADCWGSGRCHKTNYNTLRISVS